MVCLSVIIPVYNTSSHLPKCLDSLLSQTLDSIELIIVNDGSTDGSATVLEEYQLKFPAKIKVFHKKNGGLSDARNFGLERATGEFVGFVDSDDYVAPDMFSKMFGLCKKYNAQMAICNIQKVDETGKVTQKITQLPGYPEKIILRESPAVFSDISYFACNKIFRRELFANRKFKVGIHFEDIQLIPQILLGATVIAFTEEYYYQYFERADSISKKHTEKGMDILTAVEDVSAAFQNSVFGNNEGVFKKFCILQGVYSYLAYLAFVKNSETAIKMRGALQDFMKKYRISTSDVLKYRRFGKNYLLSLPLRKKIYYLLYFSGQHRIIGWLLG